jgi:hypothetical protein
MPRILDEFAFLSSAAVPASSPPKHVLRRAGERFLPFESIARDLAN